MGVQISVPLSAHSSLGHVPVVALLDPVVILCLIFLGTARLPQQLHRWPFPSAVREGSGFSRSEVGPFLVPGHGGGGPGAGSYVCSHGSHADPNLSLMV